MNNNPLEIGDLIARNIMQDHEVYPSYTADLALEGLLYLYDASKNEDYLNHVLKVWKFREENNAARFNPDILFTCLHFETYLRTGDRKFIETFVDDAHKFRASLYRDENGAVCYIIGPETKRILADMLQGYAVFMSRAGWLSGNEDFYGEAIGQYEIFSEILRNPESGLWHQGRNWGKEPGKLSHGYWNRAQGWVIRGMADVLDYLPAGSLYYKIMLEMIEEFASDLLNYQDSRGMWHQLTDKPEAFPETSGSALIVHNLYKGFHRGWLNQEKYLPVAEKGLSGLMEFVLMDGTILNTSEGSGPLPEENGYLHRPSVPDDPHAAGTMLMALAGPWLARDPKSMV